MRLWKVPTSPKALIFDLDSTLYTNPEYARFQTRILVERLAARRGGTPEATEALLDTLRAEGKRKDGIETSLGNLFLVLGISIEESVAWREELIRPAEWLVPDPRLERSLSALSLRLPLCLVTNNPRSIGVASLQALGVLGCFKFVVGLDDTGRSKPDPAPFSLAAGRLAVDSSLIVSIGDREDVDIRPALALGMGGILVESVEDVYSLPRRLFEACRP